jgi:hypothetical protein
MDLHPSLMFAVGDLKRFMVTNGLAYSTARRKSFATMTPTVAFMLDDQNSLSLLLTTGASLYFCLCLLIGEKRSIFFVVSEKHSSLFYLGIDCR